MNDIYYTTNRRNQEFDCVDITIGKSFSNSCKIVLLFMEETMYDNLKYEIENGICYLTVSRAEALNSLNEKVLTELYDAFTKISNDSNVRAVILTGEGKAFVAGADIAKMSELNSLEGRNMMKLGHSVMNLIEAIEKPVIAAVNGFALGGGCELAMACDIRIASDKAKFGQPEVNLGIIPGFGGTQRLSRLVGKGIAKYLIMTAEIIDSAEAYRIGLVEKVVSHEELIDKATELANTILSKAPIAVNLAKSVINIGYDLDMNAACQLEIETFTAAFGSEDKKEGMTAFIEKRAAIFQNK